MALKRIIPCLLLRDNGLVKTIKFKNPTYIGDPINAVKIFNEKEVDELVFLDIDATKNEKEPPYELIRDIATECFMPFCYGGGITNVEQIRRLIASGAEKVAINSAAYHNPQLIKEAASIFGSSTIVGSIDYKKNVFGKYTVYINGGKKNIKKHPVVYAKELEKLGAGEIFLNSIEKDGCMQGYDIVMIKEVVDAVSIPVIASGGAGKISHFKEAFQEGKASALAAGSLFVFQGRKKGVLISYPSPKDIRSIINE
ncbi:AglZ/HisF2 family acetamidino modification protein [Aquimarina muelleri]|uniref:imidazole glycerol-phosphate synthase n=1 Tax=Aquimarina muelleri TaxID=279356 RepID=A0A918N3F9_9FLAO|nr:AglZ/HisF2 family acetamidino modification protein [Aquimarina muelleri]MCX2764194.1 AglZ/HisF2 family acetamidino modification protein [Aquimarina muelleri]GGX19507.1 putative imidazole glycerol phosphate synthase subunit hisF2 [Aquimarina muelleri]